MPITNGIYYENQRGGLCRMHSLNAFFGKPKINPGEFKKLMDDFDKQMKAKYKQDISCKDFDMVNSDQNNIVSHVLKQHGYYARYIPINGLAGKTLPLDDVFGDFIFIYNKSHIWGLKKAQGMWWSVDSNRGVRKTNIYRVTRNKNIGLMIPVNMQKELFKHADAIKNILEKEDIKSKSDVIEYLKKLNERKEIMGDLEIHLGIIMDIVEAQTNRVEKNTKYEPIYDLLNRYNNFLTDFIEKKYSLGSLTDHIPGIISLLMKTCFRMGFS